jgi:hypothetical protein
MQHSENCPKQCNETQTVLQRSPVAVDIAAIIEPFLIIGIRVNGIRASFQKLAFGFERTYTVT